MARTIDRRTFLGAAAGATGLVVVGGWPQLVGGETSRWPIRRDHLPDNPFTLGVASGDPLTDRVILWTRLAPAPVQGGGMPDEAVEVTWEVAADEGFSSIVRTGTALATPDHAHSVHVDADGLTPNTWYWYRFSVEAWSSPVARTRTAPAVGCDDSSFRFASATCQNWTNGYYPAHGHLAEENVDAVFFLGDYIYEGGVGNGVRPHNSAEVTTLDAYRNRYGLYKGDPNLQAAHHAAPWIVTWDDHEVENNYAGAIDENNSDPATFLLRRAAAYQAWWEHQPVRLPAPTGPDLTIYRSFAWGRLASAFVLDTRQYRTDQPCGDGYGPVCDGINAPDQTMLGATQEAWLETNLLASTATWNLIPQQVVVASVPIFDIRIFDIWDGYPLARRRLLDQLARPEVANPVVLTGDIHAAGIADLLADYDDPASAVLGTELVCTSISSNFPPDLAGPLENLIESLPWGHYANTRERGYTVCDLTPDGLTASFRVVSTVAAETATVRTDFVYEIEAGPSSCNPAPPSTTSTTTTTTSPSTTSTTSPSTTSTTTTPSSTSTTATTVPAAPTAAPVAVAPTFTG